jgi:hypothetical protein
VVALDQPVHGAVRVERNVPEIVTGANNVARISRGDLRKKKRRGNAEEQAPRGHDGPDAVHEGL